MRLTLLTTLTMIAFAANSVLNRLAVGPGYIDAESFALVRLGAGMVVLVGLAWHLRENLRQPVGRLMSGGVSLTVYMIGFSLAYKSLDAGLGALILFGVVQFTMVAWNTAMGAPLGRLQLGGGVLALAGLALVLWPQGAVSVSLSGVLFMVLAGLGWGAYSLVGRGAQSPLGATAGNFVLSFVLTLAVLSMVGWQGNMTPVGVGLAILSGAVTSGLGYALWYTVLPRLPGPLAATVQLSVPVLAIAAGALALGEHLDLRIILGSGIVIAGIATVLRGGISRKVG